MNNEIIPQENVPHALQYLYISLIEHRPENNTVLVTLRSQLIVIPSLLHNDTIIE